MFSRERENHFCCFSFAAKGKARVGGIDHILVNNMWPFKIDLRLGHEAVGDVGDGWIRNESNRWSEGAMCGKLPEEV